MPTPSLISNTAPSVLKTSDITPPKSDSVVALTPAATPKPLGIVHDTKQRTPPQRNQPFDFSQIETFPSADGFLDGWVSQARSEDARAGRGIVSQALKAQNARLDEDEKSILVPGSVSLCDRDEYLELPDNLNIEHNLIARNCPNLKAIGENTRIGFVADVVFSGVETIGNGFKVGLTADFSGSPNLSTLPDDINQIGEGSPFPKVSVFLINTGINQANIPEYCASQDAPQVNFDFSHPKRFHPN